MSDRIRLAVLGSTGSIGRQALDVARAHADKIEVVALSAHKNAALIAEQAAEFGVGIVALSEPSAAAETCALAPRLTVLEGASAVSSLAELPEADVVLNALVGAAGLDATIAALSAGKTLALANKESLVVGGELVMRLSLPGNLAAPGNLASPGKLLPRLLPVDSEHSAIFQCLVGEEPQSVSRLWLTASGGPFFGMTRQELASVTAADALAHPTWTMGPKITIDSATLMNKGLEVIEAHHLFGVPFDAIAVAVHRQSCIHSMVEFSDGSVKAQLGASDMRIPIQYALSYPDRWTSESQRLDFTALGHLDFAAPDLETFGCLRLALEAGRTGGTAPAAMNAANEIAVAAFLGSQCSFLDIERTVEAVLDAHEVQPLESVEQIHAIDAECRALARVLLGNV
ncbi:MAG: 1-deoxy-D-xylulose-5-phosphate reductoisomerase [Coriobacteriia bacterium]